ncbi:MAG: S8 family serine peptidase [Chloroflexota bacterium]|nr:S8 family serine peptidase [Chloroflexota bacterium]
MLSGTVLSSHAAAAGPNPEIPEKHPKIALELRQHLAGGAVGPVDPAISRESVRRAVRLETGPGDAVRVLAAIQAAGGHVRGAVPGSIEADLPAAAIDQIASRPDVRYVSSLDRLFKHSVTTEGVASTATTTWQAQGHRGRGVKIGVIDGSFADYPARQAAGELPQTLTTADFCSGAILAPADDGAHGTAVAEIVYDMAPEASLYLICIGDGLSALQAAVNYAKTQGIRVVNFSAGYPGSSRGDGRGGPATPEGMVADAVASGITWVNAAGNSAQRHWSGTFVPSPGGQWQQFASGVDRQSFQLPYPAEVCVNLKWDEWPAAISDYDVMLFGSDPVTPVSGANRPSVGALPREGFCYQNLNPADTTFRLGVWRASGIGTPRIDLFISVSRLDNPVAAGSVVEPATVASVIAVGAACWQDGLVDIYSSRGPTIDGRIKPDILGPSEVSTATYGRAFGCSRTVGFPGTSSSAPHVAAAAALVLEVNPSFSPAQVRSFLMSASTDGGAPGPDNDYGSGLLKMASTSTVPPPPSGPCPAARSDIPTVTNYLPNVTKTLGGPEGFTTPFIVQNSGTAPTDLEIEYKRFSDGSCVLRRVVAAVAPGASFAGTLVNETALPNDAQFSVVVRSFGSTIVSVVNEHQGSGARAEAMSYVGFAEGATTVWAPNVVRRFFGYHTPIVMQNLGTATASVTARFVPFDGGAATIASRTIQPSQSQFIEPNIEPGLVDGRQYAVTLTSTQPIAVVVNTHNDGPGVQNPLAYSTDGIARGAFAVYGAYAAKNANDSGRVNTTSTIVIQNVGATAVTPSIGFVPLGGGAARRFTRRAPLAPSAAWVFDPRYANGDTTSPFCVASTADCLADGEYSFVANASGAIAAVINVISPASAMGYSASVQPSSNVSLPNVTKTLGGAGGWTTPILLQAVTATSATLSWRSFRSGVVTPQTLTLPSSGAVRIDPRSVPGLTDDTQYALTITGIRGNAEPGTLNAIVIELADGADNAMIYEGFAVGGQVATANVVLTDVFFNGKASAAEPDEYVELQNQGTLPQDMNGWRIASVRGAQTYFFSGLTMQPGQICRLYTNEVHPEWCGLSWAKAGAQWNNAGDRANLSDATGKVVSSIGYGGQ